MRKWYLGFDNFVTKIQKMKTINNNINVRYKVSK